MQCCVSYLITIFIGWFLGKAIGEIWYLFLDYKEKKS
jgi:hypothetical protein